MLWNYDNPKTQNPAKLTASGETNPVTPLPRSNEGLSLTATQQGTPGATTAGLSDAGGGIDPSLFRAVGDTGGRGTRGYANGGQDWTEANWQSGSQQEDDLGWANKEYLASLGYNGPLLNRNTSGSGESFEDLGSTVSPELQDWLKKNNLTPKTRIGEAGHETALFNDKGQQVGDGRRWGEGGEDGFWTAAMLAAGLVGGGIGAAQTAGGAAGGASTAAGEAVYGAGSSGSIGAGGSAGFGSGAGAGSAGLSGVGGAGSNGEVAQLGGEGPAGASGGSVPNNPGLNAAQNNYGALEEAGAAAGNGGNATAGGTFGSAGASTAQTVGTVAGKTMTYGEMVKAGLTAVQIAGALKAAGNSQDQIDALMNQQTSNAQTSADIANEQLKFAREQYGDAKTRQAQFDPLFLQSIQASLDSQKTQDERSAQQWDQYVKNFMPAETKLAQDAMAYDTPGRRAEAEAEARAAVANEAAQGRQAQGRALGRAGISIDSGKALTLANANRMSEAKATGAAGVGARKQTELTGLSLVDNVAKTGRGITSTGLQAAGIGLNAGQAATNGLATNQSTYNASLAPSQAMYGAAQNGLNTSSDIYGRVANQYSKQQELYNSGLAGLGSLAGQFLDSYYKG